MSLNIHERDYVIAPCSLETRLLQNCFLYDGDDDGDGGNDGDDDDDDDGVDDDIEWPQLNLSIRMCLSWLLHMFVFLSCCGPNKALMYSSSCTFTIYALGAMSPRDVNNPRISDVNLALFFQLQYVRT